jgi:signal transduction histidine kinase
MYRAVDVGRSMPPSRRIALGAIPGRKTTRPDFTDGTSRSGNDLVEQQTGIGEQVLLNLLSNAIKFTPEGGKIEIRAVPGDRSVEVSVSDTGVGIAPEDQDTIFEEFRQVGTAAKKVEGTGLGSALSRKFIELHGGRIWVQSEVGKGSTFRFTLPMS